MIAKVSRNKGWVVVAAGLAINLCLGVLYSWSVIAAYISAPKVDPVTGATSATTWGLTAAQASLPYSVALGVFAVVMVFAGRAQDKFGPRIVATIGGALIGLGLIIASFTPKGTIAMMVVGFGVLGGTGIGLGYASATPAAVKWFNPTKKGIITGIVVAGFGLASVYISPLTTWLLGAKVDLKFTEIAGLGLGVNKTFLILGILFLVITVLVAQFIKNPPKGYVVPEDTSTKEKSSRAPVAGKREYDWHEMVKTWQFYALWIMYAFVSFAGLMIIGHMAKIAKAQLPAEQAALGFLLVAILAIGNASGRIVAGMVSDKIGRTMAMMLFFMSQALFMGVLWQSTSQLLLVIGAFGVGFNYGANLTLFPATTGDYFGVKNMGVNYGLVFTAWGVGGVFGAQTAASIVDATSSYAGAYALAAGLCVLAAAMTLMVRAPKVVDMTTLEEAELAPEG
ncbi:MAG: OFA family MFS transporter [Actinomycetota bacterium]